MEEPTTTKISPATWLRSRRLPSIAHALTLAAGLVVLLYLGRDQWFFFDEWDIIWPPEAERRFVEGHNGHWSVIPIAIWRALQNVFGLSSYLPYLLVAVLVHLIVAHLLWRLMRGVGVSSWIAVSLSAVFVFFGAAAENTFWAFQMGFMGAIALALAALLIAMRATLSHVSVAAIAVLLTLAVATAGTALPFFVVIALTLIVRHGWRRTVLALALPTISYAVWYLFIAGSNPTAIYRADGIAASLTGIPAYIATMFVGGFDSVTPVPGFGIILATALVIWIVREVGRRPISDATLTALGLLASGIVFAALTAYSRLGLGLASAAESRYVYVVIVTTLPAIGLLLTAICRRNARREIAVISLIAVVGVFNAGSLVGAASAQAEREAGTHRLIAAALDLADAHPSAVDLNSRPDPVYVPRTLQELRTLESAYGLTRVPYDESDRLTALANISLSASPTSIDTTCDVPVETGSSFAASPDGTIIVASSDTDASVRVESDAGASRSVDLHLSAGPNEVRVLEPVSVVIESTTAPLTICRSR